MERRRPEFSQLYMSFAVLLSTRSTCSRGKVGCVVVSADNHRVLSVGYNGGPKGVYNECLSDQPGMCGHLHAEINALIKCDYNETAEKKIYTTTAPCHACAVAIVNAGIRKVIYLDDYRTDEGLVLLSKARVETFKMSRADLVTIPEEYFNAQAGDKA